MPTENNVSIKVELDNKEAINNLYRLKRSFTKVFNEIKNLEPLKIPTEKVIIETLKVDKEKLKYDNINKLSDISSKKELTRLERDKIQTQIEPVKLEREKTKLNIVSKNLDKEKIKNESELLKLDREKIKLQEKEIKLQDNLNKNNKRFSSIPMMSAIGASAIGFISLRNIYQTTKDLTYFSEQYNLPLKDVSKFNNVLSLFGGTTDLAKEDLKNLQNAIIDFKTTGVGALRDVGSQIGLSLYDNEGHIKNAIQLFDDLRNKFKNINKEAQIKVATELGINDPATIRYLTSTNSQYDEILKKANKLYTLNQQDAENYKRTDLALKSMKNSFIEIGAILIPYAAKATELYSNYLDFSRKIGEKTAIGWDKIIGPIQTYFQTNTEEELLARREVKRASRELNNNINNNTTNKNINYTINVNANNSNSYDIGNSIVNAIKQSSYGVQ